MNLSCHEWSNFFLLFVQFVFILSPRISSGTSSCRFLTWYSSAWNTCPEFDITKSIVVGSRCPFTQLTPSRWPPCISLALLKVSPCSEFFLSTFCKSFTSYSYPGMIFDHILLRSVYITLFGGASRNRPDGGDSYRDSRWLKTLAGLTLRTRTGQTTRCWPNTPPSPVCISIRARIKYLNWRQVVQCMGCAPGESQD